MSLPAMAPSEGLGWVGQVNYDKGGTLVGESWEHVKTQKMDQKECMGQMRLPQLCLWLYKL
jgi:hypothetical protein